MTSRSSFSSERWSTFDENENDEWRVRHIKSLLPVVDSRSTSLSPERENFTPQDERCSETEKTSRPSSGTASSDRGPSLLQDLGNLDGYYNDCCTNSKPDVAVAVEWDVYPPRNQRKRRTSNQVAPPPGFVEEPKIPVETLGKLAEKSDGQGKTRLESFRQRKAVPIQLDNPFEVLANLEETEFDTKIPQSGKRLMNAAWEPMTQNRWSRTFEAGTVVAQESQEKQENVIRTRRRKRTRKAKKTSSPQITEPGIDFGPEKSIDVCTKVIFSVSMSLLFISWLLFRV